MKALSIENVTKTYSNGVQALKGISFDIEQGDFFAMLGPNGAGKTTLIGILTSLVIKTSGKIKIFGIDIDRDFQAAKSFIGVVPQEFNFNIFEKVEKIILDQAGYYGIPRPIAKKRAEKYLKQLGLWEKRHAIVRSLSGGMKRRVLIARALVHEPKMLVLDEPTAGVDVELRRSTWSFLKRINEQQGITIILTTHYLEEAENLCRNIAIIDKGRIVEHTKMSSLLSKLDFETFIFYLKNPLTSAPGIADCRSLVIDEYTLEIEIPKTMGITNLITLLSQKNIEVISMRNKTNRLEELFLRLTNNETSHVAP